MPRNPSEISSTSSFSSFNNIADWIVSVLVKLTKPTKMLPNLRLRIGQKLILVEGVADAVRFNPVTRLFGGGLVDVLVRGFLGFQVLVDGIEVVAELVVGYHEGVEFAGILDAVRIVIILGRSFHQEVFLHQLVEKGDVIRQFRGLCVLQLFLL